MLSGRERLVNLGWLLLWGAIATAWCWSAGYKQGITYDEPFYVRGGLTNWRVLNHRELLLLGTMPLPAEVQMLPLRLAEIVASADPEHDMHKWLPIARMGTVLFVWILLWASFRLGALYGGTWGGRLAVALVACEPILLGHGSLATTDLALAACLLALLAVFRDRREESSWQRRLVLPAVWVALTFLAKASALVFVPVCLAMVELERLWSGGWRPWPVTRASLLDEQPKFQWRPVLLSLRDLILVGTMGVALLFVACPRALRGLKYQIQHNRGGHGDIFLFGEFSPTGFWYYFPAALAIKLTLPVFVLLAVVLIVKHRYLMNGAIVAAAGLLAMTPAFRVQIGVRFVLPIAALVLIGAAAAWGRWWSERLVPHRPWLLGGIPAACVAWSLASACLVWPNGICYTNELFGGMRHSHLLLSDSNLDWGQGLHELADWRRSHADAPLRLWYFGSDPVGYEPTFRPLSPHDLEHGELPDLCSGCYLAASPSLIYGYEHNTPAAQLLRTLEPYDQTSTYLIYDFRRPSK
jgi:hypothetical protein